MLAVALYAAAESRPDFGEPLEGTIGETLGSVQDLRRRMVSGRGRQDVATARRKDRAVEEPGEVLTQLHLLVAQRSWRVSPSPVVITASGDG